MKKNILSALAIYAVLFSCQKNEMSEAMSSGAELHAIIEDDACTKTVMDEDNNIRWSEGDQIVAFMKTSLGLKYQLKDSYVGETFGYFSKVSSGSSDDLGAGMGWDHIVAYYPYAESIKCAKSGDNYTLDVVLPAEQTYAAESFCNGSFPMAAVSGDNDITFRNICGGMKLRLKGSQKVASVKVHGKNNEKLSGAATVTAYTDGETKPVITMSDEASTSVTLNCGEGIQLSESTATEFIIVLPPVLFSKGFIVTVTDLNGKERTIQTDEENSVLRSSLLVMPEVTVVEDSGQLCDYIDEYGINHGHGFKIGEIVWAPVNCGYHAEKFKYGKLYQWGRKYGQGYNNGHLYVDGKVSGTYSDAEVPTIEAGGVSVTTGNDKGNADVFYKGSVDNNYDWIDSLDEKLWNSGTESDPVKTGYDPCPSGWRVPTYHECFQLSVLKANKQASWTSEEGQSGYLFSGADSDAQVFFPVAGYLRYHDGLSDVRGKKGCYWSSYRHSEVTAYYLHIYSGYVGAPSSYCAYGYSVRCVQE